MIDFVLALGSALLVVFYWSVCRRRSLSARVKLAALVIAYENDDTVGDAEKDAAQWSYSFATSWFFMPVMTLVAAPFLLWKIIRTDASSPVPEARDKIMNLAITMYIIRNPITSVVCLIAFSIMASLVAPVGILLNKFRGIPTAQSVYGAIAESASHAHIGHASA